MDVNHMMRVSSWEKLQTGRESQDVTDWVAILFITKKKEVDSSEMKNIIKHKVWNYVYYSLPMPVPEEKK